MRGKPPLRSLSRLFSPSIPGCAGGAVALTTWQNALAPVFPRFSRARPCPLFFPPFFFFSSPLPQPPFLPCFGGSGVFVSAFRRRVLRAQQGMERGEGESRVRSAAVPFCETPGVLRAPRARVCIKQLGRRARNFPPVLLPLARFFRVDGESSGMCDFVSRKQKQSPKALAVLLETVIYLFAALQLAET